jgi:hypothetical protein
MSISKITDEYVIQNPSIRDSLQKGLINYSKLSRIIIKDEKLKEKDFNAILVALTRLEYKLKKKKSYQKKIKEILKKTNLEIKTKVLVCIVEKNIFYQNLIQLQNEIKIKKGYLHIVEGTEVITLITDQNFEEEIKKHFKNKIIKLTLDLIQIILKSPSSLEEVPGVTGYLYSLFSDKEINIIETISCWTDTILIIDKNNLNKAIKLLEF